MVSRKSPRQAAVIGIVALLFGSGVMLFQTSRAENPHDGDTALNAEIAAVERDLLGSRDPEQRAAAEAKLAILIEERAARAAARSLAPANNAQDATKAAQLDISSKEAASEAAGYSPVIRATGTGQFVEGTPWDRQRDAFAATVSWRSAPGSDGVATAIWAGGFRGDSPNGALLVRRFVASSGTVVEDRMLQITGHGTVMLADEKDGILELRGSDGKDIAFDTKTMAFK